MPLPGQNLSGAENPIGARRSFFRQRRQNASSREGGGQALRARLPKNLRKAQEGRSPLEFSIIFSGVYGVYRDDFFGGKSHFQSKNLRGTRRGACIPAYQLAKAFFWQAEEDESFAHFTAMPFALRIAFARLKFMFALSAQAFHNAFARPKFERRGKSGRGAPPFFQAAQTKRFIAGRRRRSPSRISRPCRSHCAGFSPQFCVRTSHRALGGNVSIFGLFHRIAPARPQNGAKTPRPVMCSRAGR